MRLRLKLTCIALCAAGMALPAGDPEGFKMWKADDLKMFTKTLGPKVNATTKVATEQLGAVGNYSFMVAHREGSGEAEYHEKQADIFVVETGEGTLIIGGKMNDGHTTAPNEIRAPSITGGVEKKIAAGDVLTIPAKLPHQVKVDAGKQITYFVVKVTQ
jgi:mannose-6-phosphate isomerase-like protein (cupin superfamily)